MLRHIGDTLRFRLQADVIGKNDWTKSYWRVVAIIYETCVDELVETAQTGHENIFLDVQIEGPFTGLLSYSGILIFL